MKNEPPPPPRSSAPPGDLPSEGSPSGSAARPVPPRPQVPLVDFQLDDLTSLSAPRPAVPLAAEPEAQAEPPPPRPARRQVRVTPRKTPPQTEASAEALPAAPPSQPAAPAEPSRAARPRRGIKPGWLVLSGLLAGVLLFLSWSQVPVKVVQVSGNTHLSSREVRRLAGLPEDRSPFGWLYYGAWKARGLLASPWIASAEVTRKFPDTVLLAVSERQPFARWQRPGGAEVLVAEDGTALPTGAGITPGDLARLPVVTGWGPERLPEALRLTRALSRYTVQSVTYTPAGFTAKTASGTAWGGDLETFVKYAGSIGMYPNKKIHIYPWGVSVQE